jgi:hypothetical protein
VGDGVEHRVLTRRQSAVGHLRLKDVSSTLSGAVKEVNGGTFQPFG